MSRNLLLVDIGNSRVKWVQAGGGKWLHGAPFSGGISHLLTSLDRYWAKLTPPAAVHVSNVAGPAVAERFTAWVRAHWDTPVHFAVSEASRGRVINGYAEPARLGVDRWLGLLGLHRYHPLPACLVDCGTAITLDVLDAEGQHRGGLIAPGLATMRRSLRQDTHALDLASAPSPMPPSLALDTAAGIAAGCLLAGAGLVEKTLTGLRAEFGDTLQLVITGGDAVSIRDQLSRPCTLDEHMVLRGLLVLAEG